MNWIQLLNSDRPSKGRVEENPYLNLSPYERDFYTIVVNSAFRRLQRKTQVYTLDDNDFTRTRLTHSMEVSAIAEILGKLVGKNIEERNNRISNGEYAEEGYSAEELPKDFVENLAMVLRCSGLLHDIGNPPFGHSGEEYIRDYFENNSETLRKGMPDELWLDFINFEGNAQNIRIITKLGQSSNPLDTRFGMDLTNAVINSVIKYPYGSMVYNSRSVGEDGKRKRGKIGYYHADKFVLDYKDESVMRKTGTLITVDGEDKALKNPIMLLMEAADDIAYATADVEDAIKKHFITEKDFLEKLPEECRSYFPCNKPEDVLHSLKSIREQSIIDVVDEFMANYEDIMEGTYEKELIQNTYFKLSDLKSLLKNIYVQRDRMTEYKHNSKNKIFNILEVLLTIIEKDPSERDLSENIILSEMDQYVTKCKIELYHSLNHNFSAIDEKHIIRYYNYLAVVDFISGMTDSYVGIFCDKIKSMQYTFEKQYEYKQKCIDELLKSDSFRSTSEAMQRIKIVNSWTNLELSMIIKAIIMNDQVYNAAKFWDSDKEIMLDIYKKYNHKDVTILTDDEVLDFEKKMEASTPGDAARENPGVEAENTETESSVVESSVVENSVAENAETENTEE